jgi:hypothetical protein
MLWRLTRIALLVAVVAFGIFGAVSFVAPAWAAQNFPWSVGPFLAMSIGGWTLGTAAIALDARRRTPPTVTAFLIYLWLFGAGELVVLLAFGNRTVWSAPLTIPYLIGLLALIVSAATGVPALWLDRRGAPLESGRPVPLLTRAWTVGFVLVLLGLVLATLLARQGGAATEAGFVPERMTLFTVRAFSAFFLAIGLSAASLLVTNRLDAYVAFGQAGLYLIVPITIAALVNLSTFDFAARPGGLMYLGAYIVVGVVVGLALWRDRARRAADAAGTAQSGGGRR